MTDAITSAVAQVAVGTPLSEAYQAIKHALVDFKDDVVSLQCTRTTIEAALLDADSLVEHSHTQQDLMEKLRYELDRLTAFLVIREAKAMRKEVMGGSRFMKEARLFFSASNQPVALFLDARKVKDMRNKLDAIARDYAQFGSIVSVPTVNQTQVWSTQTTGFHIVSDMLVGRDEDKDKIISMITALIVLLLPNSFVMPVCTLTTSPESYLLKGDSLTYLLRKAQQEASNRALFTSFSLLEMSMFRMLMRA